MSEQTGITVELDDTTPEQKRKHRWWRWLGYCLLLGVVAIVGASLLLNSPIGKRIVADQIAEVAPASGLRFKVGRIDGDLFGKAVLHDVKVLDPKGTFLTVPEVDLNWRPMSWFTSGLDVRELALHRGTLHRLPELLPGDPDAPILPDFDIRVDLLEIDNLTIAEGVATPGAQRVDMQASADIRSGRLKLEANGKLGRDDRLALLLDAEPDGDLFDFDLDVRAPQGGVIGGLVGTRAGYTARAQGDGTWQDWAGTLLVRRDERNFAAMKLSNRAGRYGAVGQLYPAPPLSGFSARALGQAVSLATFVTLEDSTIAGQMAVRGGGIEGEGFGAIDLGDNRFEEFRVLARLADPALFGDAMTLQGAKLAATLDGPFRNLSIEHVLVADRLEAGAVNAERLAQQGVARFDGARWTLPVNLGVERVVTGQASIDPRLVGGTVTGTITYEGSRLSSEELAISLPDASARLALVGDTGRGGYALAGPVRISSFAVPDVGLVEGQGDIVLGFGNAPWNLKARFDARVPRVSNATLANVAGEALVFRGGMEVGGVQALRLDKVVLAGSKLSLLFDGTVAEGRTAIAGTGKHVDYGSFSVEAALAERRPEAVLVFADPYPAAGLKDVRVAIAPREDGFAIETQGQSLLGSFDGRLGLLMPSGGPAQLAVQRFEVWETDVTGTLTLAERGIDGTLALSGGGLDGTILFDPRADAQAIDFALKARNARFGGATPLSIARANIEGQALLRDGSSTINGNALVEGLGYGRLFLGRMAGSADLTDGSGKATLSLAGRRGSRFSLQADAGIAPERIAVIARGDFAGKAIAMPRRAILARQAEGGWTLQRTQLSYGKGVALAQGNFGDGTSEMQFQLAKMPLSLLDLAVSDVGLGGTISGEVDFARRADRPLTGNARVKVDGLTRSGLVLTSRPVDLALVAQLREDRLETRAVIAEDGAQRGRVQARITDLPRLGSLYQRLEAGDLFGQLRYKGPADALWRLAAVEAFDLTGTLSAAANITGSLANPQVRGSVASDDLRVRSGLSGTDIRDVSARGTFAGSRLRLTRFAGTARNGGTVSGSGFVDLAGMGPTRGPSLDLKIATSNAALLDAAGLKATVTGPLRIVSDGSGGTIAGRLDIKRASWKLGTAAEAAQLPDIKTREINAPADIAPPSQRGAAWRYLIDARAPSRVDVDGMGLDSEWKADIRLRGTTSDPRIGGEAEVVRGDYTFAGTRFDLSRGRIVFDQNGPIDPQLDILAETKRDGLEVNVTVQGSALQPEITFGSTPALPEEEILARLLFGGSITELSATDALQLGTALASLRGGGGLDPINKLRSAIGLDRLRIVGADPALGRGTGVALGKNIGRRFYAELITDGRGYSATELEFRITSWLSLLSSVSTVGRESVVLEASKDY
ncbi:MAG: translocation/assembly module TamB domain-containing protein [Sphingomonadaceae bacterium]|nr:translocation/assembly module TamB domain-containing protein [Sphingomonadaceae bacterium]